MRNKQSLFDDLPWFNKLKDRWKVTSSKEVILILLVFACTGFTVMFLEKPILNFFVIDGSKNIGLSLLYYLLILPIYNIFLLIYGFLFGQFHFFWNFEKKMFKRLFTK